jgi:cell division protein FtsL
LANLYNQYSNLFAKIIETNTIEDFYKLFQVEASSYWETHYNFGKVSKHSKKKITKSFIDLLLINTIIPIKFSYAKYQVKDINDEIIKLISEISSEKNSIVNAFNKIKPISKSALESQAIIQLKTNYCDKNKCLQCEIGNVLLTRNV